jgi:hypothetical protein
MAEAATTESEGPKAGRRAGRRANDDGGDGKGPDAPVGRRRAADGSEIAGGRADAPSGWGEPAAGASAFPVRAPKPLPEPEDDEEAAAGRRRMKRVVADEPAEEVVAIIRDNDEEVAEDLAMKVAEAPRNAGTSQPCHAMP